MSLPTSYLTSTKNLEAILNAIQGAQAPDKFTQAFLETLEFKGTADRLVIGVLKSLGFLDDGGRPTERYFKFLDQTQGKKVLGEAVKSAYADVFQINKKAHLLSKQDLIQKFKTLSQGKISDSVLDKMAMTFVALVKHGDFAESNADQVEGNVSTNSATKAGESSPQKSETNEKSLVLGGLVYNIQLILPESRDQAVYDALFQSLRRHLV